MGRTLQTRRPFRLASIAVDPMGNKLSRDGAVTAVEPQVMDALCVLAANAGVVVSRAQLIDEAWPVDYVSDESVTRVVSLLRKAFSDLDNETLYIETIPKRGYKLCAPVVFEAPILPKPVERVADVLQTIALNDNPASHSSQHRQAVQPAIEVESLAEPIRNSWRGILIFLGLVLLALVALLKPSLPDAAPDRPLDRSIAVLPFMSMSVESEDELFAQGLSEELLISLDKIEDLKIAARRSSFAFRNSEIPISEIGDALDVSYVLEGSIRRVEERLRISAQLVSVRDGFHIWTNSYDREIDDVFIVQDDIARQVAGALDAVFNQEDVLFDAGTDTASAFRNYLEARSLLHKRGAGVAQAISFFEKAIDADPDYARAYSGLATAHAVSHIYLDVPKDIASKRAETFADKALALDERLSEPHAVLGVIAANQRDWTAALQHFENGERSDPDNVTVLQWHAEALTHLGYLDRAEAKILRAIEIDPNSAVLALVAGNIYHNKNDMVRTEQFHRRSETLGLTSGVNGNAFVELANGNIQRAAYMTAVAAFYDQYIAETEVDALTEALERVIRRELSADSAFAPFPVLLNDDDFMTPAYLMAGESERALNLLESDPDGDQDSLYLLWTNLDPGLRQDAYFQTFIRNMGLLEVWEELGWPDRCKAVEQSGALQVDCR